MQRSLIGLPDIVACGTPVLKGLSSFTSPVKRGDKSTKITLSFEAFILYDFQMGTVKLRSNEAFSDELGSQMFFVDFL